MPRLPEVKCPKCNETMGQTDLSSAVRTARRYEDCLRECESCEIGASNAKELQSVTFICKDPLENIPPEARDGAPATLCRALNRRNRETKRIRIGFSTSEDVVTWVVFSQLLRSGRLVEALIKAGVSPEAAEVSPSLLLWGVPIDDGSQGPSILSNLLKTIQRTEGTLNPRSPNPTSLSILVGFGLMFIEAKYRSDNDVKPPDYRGWSRHLDAGWVDWRKEAVRESGLYELARNWCLLSGIAGDRPKTLVNLGSDEIFASQDVER